MTPEFEFVQLYIFVMTVLPIIIVLDHSSRI